MKKDDGTFSIVSYNSTVSAFTGVRTEDIGKLDWSKGYCTDIIEEDVPKMKAALDRLCKIGDTSGIDYKIHKNGSWMALSCTNTAVARTAEGLVIQRIAFDIT